MTWVLHYMGLEEYNLLCYKQEFREGVGSGSEAEGEVAEGEVAVGSEAEGEVAEGEVAMGSEAVVSGVEEEVGSEAVEEVAVEEVAVVSGVEGEVAVGPEVGSGVEEEVGSGAGGLEAEGSEKADKGVGVILHVMFHKLVWHIN
jgi:hypothetical protein